MTCFIAPRASLSLSCSGVWPRRSPRHRVGDCHACQRRLDTGKDSFTGANGALANTRLVVGTTSTGPNLTITGSVLTNDPDIDTPTRLTAGPALISSANCAGCNNVTMEPDGNFIYDPPAGFTGNDTFTYTVNDNDPDTPPNQTDTATVTIEVVGPLVWYVDIDAAAPPAGQGGRSHSPFNSLAPLTTGGTADGLDGAGDIIFVGVDTAPATGPYEGGFVLEANQRLWGEPFGLNVDPTGPIPATQLVAATPGTPVANNPNIRNTALGGNGITLANGVDIQRINAGVNSTASNAAGISGTAITTATIGPNQLIQGNATGITLSGAAGGNVTIAATISGNSATAVSVANRSSGTVTVSGDVSGTAGNAAVILTNNTGATIVFTGAINLAGTGAAISKFSATGGGTITANNAANQITGFTGTGITLGGVTIGAAGVTFNTVSTAPAGAANGILLTNVAGGAFTVNNGAITATARALDVDDNSGNVTIGATLTTSGAAARSVEVTNRDGGIVDINGLVTDTSQGINLTTNGTGTIRFDGGIVASTTTFTAFNATGGGTIAVTDINGATVPNNTLTTTTGTALNVANTNIHADGLDVPEHLGEWRGERDRPEYNGLRWRADGDGDGCRWDRGNNPEHNVGRCALVADDQPVTVVDEHQRQRRQRHLRGRRRGAESGEPVHGQQWRAVRGRRHTRLRHSHRRSHRHRQHALELDDPRLTEHEPRLGPELKHEHEHAHR